MQIIVRLIGPFRIDRFKEEIRDYSEGTRVDEIVEELKLSLPLLGIVLINGEHASVTHPLSDGDTLSLLPLLGGG